MSWSLKRERTVHGLVWWIVAPDGQIYIRDHDAARARLVVRVLNLRAANEYLKAARDAWAAEAMDEALRGDALAQTSKVWRNQRDAAREGLDAASKRIRNLQEVNA